MQDSFFGFTAALGIDGRSMRWDIPLDRASLEYAERAVPSGEPALIVSPCSSHDLRNWSPERYAAVADHAVARHGMRVLICGGRSDLELSYGARIAELMRHPATNLVGKDTLLELPRYAGARQSRAHAGLRTGAHGDDRRYAGCRALCGDQPGAQWSLLQSRVVRRPVRCGGTTLPWSIRR